MVSKVKKPGTWSKGHSGNPKGRPPGVGEIAQMRHNIAEHIPAIITQLVDRAKNGDSQAARLLLERVLPPLKPMEQAVTLSLPAGEGMTAQGVAIIDAVASGTLAPGQGASLLTGLGSLARIAEIDELAKRVARLEEVKNGRY